MTILPPLQVPNFLLASPTLLIGTAAVATYIRRDLARAFTLGRLGPGPLQARVGLLLECVMPSLAAQDSTDKSARSRRRKDPRPLSSGFYADGVFVFVVQLAAMLLIAALFMHIQVCTWQRFVDLCFVSAMWHRSFVLDSVSSGAGSSLLQI